MGQATEVDAWSWTKISRVLIKTLVLFAIFNLVFAGCNLWPLIGKLSVYNSIVPGRKRLPYGSDPERSYNLTTSQLEVMIASHEISGDPISAGEYRVIILGDSSVWGFLLQPGETISAQIDADEYYTTDGRRVRAYNFGYPTMSLTKDLLLLWQSLEFEPDLIVWFFTLESFWRENQIEAPLVQYNPAVTRELMLAYQLDLDLDDPRFQPTTFWQRTIIGQRRELANTVRLQFYAGLWASTEIDRYIPSPNDRNDREMPRDLAFHGLQPDELREDQLAFDVLVAGVTLASEVPVLLINEPIFIQEGNGSTLHYNAHYPRWVYDAFREWLWRMSDSEGWTILDLWTWLPANLFADGGVHYDAEGASALASFLGEQIQSSIAEPFEE